MRSLFRLLSAELPVVIAAIAAAIAIGSGVVRATDVPRIVDWRLLAILFALLVSVESLRVSNALDLLVARTLSRFTQQRSFTVALVLVSGVLAAVVTNDVALFVVIPFSMAATRLADFDAENAVMLQIIAANLIGCISPLGNPQNLFVYQLWRISAAQFVTTMAPFVAVAGALLLASIWLLEKRGPLTVERVELPPIDPLHAVAGGVGFLLVVLNIARLLPVWPAVIAAIVFLPLVIRHEESRIDLSIIPLFFFAFIAVEGLRRGGAYYLLGAGHVSDLRLYCSAVAGSQAISNVPATILLSPVAEGRWKVLLYAVNAGGCGTIIASLANLLGWQIYRRHGGEHPHFFRRFMGMNALFLVVIAATGWMLL
jgi:Na+/H+ antiporter NhaD/arsenite permease-like protein